MTGEECLLPRLSLILPPCRQSHLNRTNTSVPASYQICRRNVEGRADFDLREALAAMMCAVAKGPVHMAHILVVDDDVIFRSLITRALEAIGHSVVTCENGRKAVDHIEHAQADLLITDILMPEMDGVETVRAVRRLQPQFPILAISGGGPANAADFLGLAQVFGATETLLKPFQPAELLAAVSRLLLAGPSPN
ncbi:MAG TPA: response regulator [Stellaceae bacterium]|nr:response regulator [Stellaceae bacterium]